MTGLKSDIRYCLLYDIKRGKTAAESHRDLCDAFGQDAISEWQCQRWFHKVRSGNESLEDDARGRPSSMVDMEQLKEAIKEDLSQITRDLANRFGCSHPTIMRCLHALGKSSWSGQLGGMSYLLCERLYVTPCTEVRSLRSVGQTRITKAYSLEQCTNICRVCWRCLQGKQCGAVAFTV
ncbi:hypothetical protein ANCDUO_05488 [Ancylostoma duodenale]|uniref:Mos1 transposase HTH domain-containing protein n=1 Tax=Ancylostoma duodenale TaxID=51022 RepID=A0A0C2H470_9BILA|nr:hypothetical protein ANCDUO_05488 [Ancylostoma duodenale]